MVGGKHQPKAGLSPEVTIEYTEHVGGLFSSVWDGGGLGIRGVIIWSFRASKGSSRVTGVAGLLLRLHRRLRRARRLEVRLWPFHAGPRQTAPTKGGIDPESWHQLRGEEVQRQGRSYFANTQSPSWLKQSLAWHQETRDRFNPKGRSASHFQRE